MANSSEKTSFWNLLTLYLAAVLLCTLAYYLIGMTPTVAWIVAAALIGLGIFLFQKDKSKNLAVQTKQKNSTLYSLFSPLSVAFDLILLAVLIVNRTDTLLPSPWGTLEPWFFLLFALATFCVLFTKNIAAISLHFFVMLAVAPIIYTLGFGFDAFIHRATETWIQTHGFILPKTPYYIGQYSVVVWLAHLTRIPIFYLDIYLVPTLAALTLPATVILTGRKSLLFWLIPFVPFLSLHLTTPHNLVLLYGLLIVFTSFPENEHVVPPYVPILLAAAALATHPLLGAPLAIFVLARRMGNRLAPLLAFIGTALAAPFLFLANNFRIGAGLPSIVNPIEQLPKFLALFDRPYWYLKHAPILFETLYAWQWLIVPVVIGLAAYGFYLRRNYLLLAGAAGLFVSAWLLTSWIVFPDVVSYEQGEYPMRLLKASIIFLLPLAMAGLQNIFRNIKILKYRYLIAALAAILLMLSLYFSYPQRNIKSRFPGYNVTAADFQAVEWIHNRHETYDYIVLANQLVSAAALTNYSFAKYFNNSLFYYALPTGGELYKYYGKMIYEGQKREYMTDAMNLAGADTAYFIVNSYWANSDKIIDGAKKTADSWESFDGGVVWVFVYKKL